MSTPLRSVGLVIAGAETKPVDRPKFPDSWWVRLPKSAGSVCSSGAVSCGRQFDKGSLNWGSAGGDELQGQSDVVSARFVVKGVSGMLQGPLALLRTRDLSMEVQKGLEARVRFCNTIDYGDFDQDKDVDGQDRAD